MSKRFMVRIFAPLIGVLVLGGLAIVPANAVTNDHVEAYGLVNCQFVGKMQIELTGHALIDDVTIDKLTVDDVEETFLYYRNSDESIAGSTYNEGGYIDGTQERYLTEVPTEPYEFVLHTSTPDGVTQTAVLSIPVEEFPADCVEDKPTIEPVFAPTGKIDTFDCEYSGVATLNTSSSKDGDEELATSQFGITVGGTHVDGSPFSVPAGTPAFEQNFVGKIPGVVRLFADGKLLDEATASGDCSDGETGSDNGGGTVGGDPVVIEKIKVVNIRHAFNRRNFGKVVVKTTCQGSLQKRVISMRFRGGRLVKVNSGWWNTRFNEFTEPGKRAIFWRVPNKFRYKSVAVRSICADDDPDISYTGPVRLRSRSAGLNLRDLH